MSRCRDHIGPALTAGFVAGRNAVAKQELKTAYLFETNRFLLAASLLALVAHRQLRRLSGQQLLRCVRVGTVFGIAGLTGTAIAHPFYFAWMGVAFVIGNIMSRVIMVLVYFLVVTPIGLLMRMTGRDRLRLKKTKEDTYWTDAPHCNKDSYHRQF